ncbi:exosortase/archaeosortase family protein [Haloferula luteola]|uniref:Exosortase/archaeosortase family protein n=1 Tax=Haloferula luteola TaxID=595692 RepID=A0A840VCN5_9BACT|nr:archaeosortase/exosortase family protein [Haloferula luteola]MBB5351569.1 exosortase/archaeosortase family protein [Haloferula luteola]
MSSTAPTLEGLRPLERSSVALLGVIFPLIWALDRRWWQLSPDVLVILAILPLSWRLARQHSAVQPSRPRFTLPAAILLGIGILANQMTLMAFGWSWLAVSYFLPATSISPARLGCLLTGAFPWVLTDGDPIGWWFRLTGAHLTALTYEAAGYHVVAHGTELVVGGIPISVEAACGGMKLLQVLMSGGVALTALQFPRQRGFWIMVGLLPVLAWLANTLRIIVITGWSLRFGIDAAAGAFHTWGAMGVIGTMLGSYLALSHWISKRFA